MSRYAPSNCAVGDPVPVLVTVNVMRGFVSIFVGVSRQLFTSRMSCPGAPTCFVGWFGAAGVHVAVLAGVIETDGVKFAVLSLCTRRSFTELIVAFGGTAVPVPVAYLFSEMR